MTENWSNGAEIALYKYETFTYIDSFLFVYLFFTLRLFLCIRRNKRRNRK